MMNIIMSETFIKIDLLRVSQVFWGTREHEPTFREQGNRTVQIRGHKHFDIRNKERYF